ncbi:MAG TPA: hypothetical protein VGG74_11820 [Kofleriaceae bacterium]|jgi:hypothetical protein
MAIKHTFVSSKPDSSDSSQVKASNWNADHTITSDVDFATHKAINVVDPTNPQDAATKNYVDTHGSSGGGFTPAAGSFNSGTFSVTATATSNAIVEVTNPGADTAIVLVDLGSAPSTGQLLVLAVSPTSTGGFDCLTGGTPSGTAKAFAASSSIAPPGSSIWFYYDGATWSPLFATPGQNLKVTNDIISANSISASGDIQATELLMGGALRVQACILATNVGANATVDLNATGEGVTQRLFLNGQTGTGGSISNIINSVASPTGGQTIDIINSSAYPVTLNAMAGGTGQIWLPNSLSTLVMQPGMTVFCDYDGANELGHGSNVVIVMGWSSPNEVFFESGGYFGKPGVILINQSTGDINTAGGITASGTVDTGGGLELSGSTGFVYASGAASSGNQDVDVDAAGTGAVRVNYNAGGLANAGSGGLVVYGGANGSTPKVALGSDGSITLNNGPKIQTGSGSPNSSVTGNPGDLYLNTGGGSATTLWVKESGTGTNTGWVGK